MPRLILVRHGQTRSNVHGLLDTAAPGPGLTALGREQAAALPEVLAGERIDRVVASPLVRAVETATPLADGLRLPLGQDGDLREIQAGDLELRADRDSMLVYLRTAVSWAGGDVESTMPGVTETGADFLRRFDRAVEAAVAGVDTAVCVSHGAAIRTWVSARGAGLEPGYGADHGLPNTGIVILDREADGPWQVRSWTDRRTSEQSDPTGAPVR